MLIPKLTKQHNCRNYFTSSKQPTNFLRNMRRVFDGNVNINLKHRLHIIHVNKATHGLAGDDKTLFDLTTGSVDQTKQICLSLVNKMRNIGHLLIQINGEFESTRKSLILLQTLFKFCFSILVFLNFISSRPLVKFNTPV